MNIDTTLTDETRNRITRKVLIHKLSQEDIGDKAKSMKRELPNVAKNMDEKLEDLEALFKELFPEALAHKLGCKSVSINW